MNTPNFTKDDGIALTVTLSLCVALLLFSLWYTIDMHTSNRPSFIEVEFGEYKAGSLAEFSKVKNEEVATSPKPSDIKTDAPEEALKPEKTPQNPTDDNTKPVDLPDEVEDVKAEAVETPKTEIIDPNKTATDEVVKEIVIPPAAKKDASNKEGADVSGDIKGAKGDIKAEQGEGKDQKKTSPYELKWEGNIERDPMVQPLPTNTSNNEAVISVKFEVRPDGTVGRIIPLRKMNPELEREVMKTLRSWRFSRLPSGVPQQAQWGTITFRFVFG